MAEEDSQNNLNLSFLRTLFLSYSSIKEFEIIGRAYKYASEAHEGQKREDGKPYITHPLEVASILAEHRFDAITLSAALLHDVIEDCGKTKEDIEEKFGAEVAELIEGVTKISTISANTRQEQEAENLRRMLVAVARDIRVLLIKLADRLHNMRTISALDKNRVERISRETLEIYAPLANRMGMSTIKSELEDLSFKHLMPDKYREVSEAINANVGKRAHLLTDAVEQMQKQVRDSGISAQIASRSKEIYSVYKKMLRQKRPIEEIFDLLAMRVLVSSVKECYTVLGIAHNLWTPIPGRFKDYIGTPKPNMYQAIHTTVIGPGDGPIEIQIKTHEMHNTAEEGIAAHWKYKSEGAIDERLGWLRRILDWQRESLSAQEFMDSLRIDLYDDQVFVLTPKGDIFELPKGATPIDMAYAVHSDIGKHLSGAKVNGRMVPITTRLTSGAVVEIITLNSAKPSRDWLNFVRTPRARQKIRHHLKENESKELKKRGSELLQAALNNFKLNLSVAKKSSEIIDAIKAAGFKELESALEAIGFGNESAEAIARKIAERKNPTVIAQKPISRQEQKSSAGSNVIVDGFDGLFVRFSKCCNPVPGDKIIAYLSRGRGVAIHKNDCPNITDLSNEPARIRKAEWSGKTGKFSAAVLIEGSDRIGLLADITQAIAKEGGNILSADIKTKEKGKDNFVIEVNDAEHLSRLIEALKDVEGVCFVARAGSK